MMSRWISLVPPPKVITSDGAVEALEPAGEHGAVGVAGDAGVGPDDLHQRAVDLGGQLGAVDLGGRRLGGGEVRRHRRRRPASS